MRFLFTILLCWLVSCNPGPADDPASNRKLAEGPWIVQFNIGEEIIPFTMNCAWIDTKPVLVIQNGDERIEVREIQIDGDSIEITIPVFGTFFKGKFVNDSSIAGFWHNPSRSKDYKIPFRAFFGEQNRFRVVNESNISTFDGKWEVRFSPKSDDYCKAVGLFKQHGNIVTGTFLTETGDYRFLEGVVNGNEMSLSCFDGSHAFLFKAVQSGDGKIDGRFWSGNHWEENWAGVRNDQYELSHPDSLTTVVGDLSDYKLEFMGLDKGVVSLNDDLFKDKVIILQIMGSWCPNCADESRDFAEIYRNYHDRGLEILAVAYERSEDVDVSIKRIQKFKFDLGADYLFTLGDGVGKTDASSQFSFLNEIISFPTAIFIDHNGTIRKVHTGYYGPGSGEYYMRHKENIEQFVDKLLREKSAMNFVNP